MYSFRISLIAAIIMSLAFAPLVFAENDDNKGKGKNDDKEKKAWMNFTAASTTEGLAAQIKSLTEMLVNLKKQREDASKNEKKDIVIEIRETKQELKFIRNLVRGMSGDDVKDLQELLAEDPEIFSKANITGFFGPLTEAAVKKFQKKHGIEQVGAFGPKTQAKMLALFLGRPLPPGLAKKFALSSTTPGVGMVTVCHKPAGENPHTLVIAVPALGAHLAHGDSVGLCQGGTGTTTPDTTKPNLSSVTATPGATTATIMWTTNENATSEVLYGLTSSYGSSTSNSTLLTSHSMMLSGLMPSTLYHFMVKSADGAGTVATSSDLTFTTTASADTTAPGISNIVVSGVSTTSATVTWSTSESATGKVYFGTVNPVVIGSGSNVATILGSSHSAPLTGLTASTTYYYAIEVKDAANNTATTSTQSFVTN